MQMDRRLTHTHYAILIRNTVCLQRLKVMSFRGYFWHTVVLPEADRFARAEEREKYLYLSVETD